MFSLLRKINPRSFWHFQIIGFAVFYFAELLIIFAGSRDSIQSIGEATEVPVFFVLSLFLRQIYKRIHYQEISIPRLLSYICFWSLVSIIIWFLIIANINWRIFDVKVTESLMDFKHAINWIMIIYPVHLGWGLLYFGIKIWIDWDNERLKAEKATVLAQRAQLQLLRYQVNPHFLFNSLNSIRALVDEDRQNAKNMITELSEFLRYSLLNKNQFEIKLKDELDAIRHYISIEKKRYEEKLDVRFEVDPETEEIPVLGFLIHPLVENAIKYGMQTSPMPLKILLRTKIISQKLQISVLNSGNWVKESHRNYSTGTGTGLENVKARLENVFNKEYNMKISEEKDQVSVTLEIPVSYNKGNS